MDLAFLQSKRFGHYVGPMPVSNDVIQTEGDKRKTKKLNLTCSNLHTAGPRLIAREKQFIKLSSLVLNTPSIMCQ